MNSDKEKMIKSTHPVFLVVTAAFCFFSLNFAWAAEHAQTKDKVKPTATSTTKAKKTTTAVKQTSKTSSDSKTTVKTVSKAVVKTKPDTKIKVAKSVDPVRQAQKSATVFKDKTPKPKPPADSNPAKKIIVSATSVRVRSQPNANSKVLNTLNIGTVLSVLDKNSAWFQVKLADDKSGWVSKNVTLDFDSAKRSEITQKIAAKYIKSTVLSFADAAQIFDFLKSSPTGGSDLLADLQFKRLLALGIALKKIPFGKDDQNPYKDFVKTNENEIVYSEPSAEWYVRANAFWELHNQYKNLSIGEEIAWQAAQTQLPGECEGYVNCYLYNIRATDGEYLNFYPGGKYSKKALQNITYFLEPIIGDLKEKAVYSAAADISDRADFNRYLAELRKIISKVPYLEKAKTLKQINQLGEGYR